MGAVAHADIFDTRDNLRTYFVGSLALHVAIFGGGAAYEWARNAGRVPFGDPNSLGGGSVVITAVSQIPLPGRGGPKNLVASDSESQVPRPPEAVKPAADKDDPDAVVLKGRASKKASRRTPPAPKYKSVPYRPGQAYSNVGQALSSPMYGQTRAGGGVGIGPGGAFGSRFGWYQQLVQERIAQKWRTGDLDPRLESAPPVIVTFDILRDGSVRDIRILQRSGNYALDMSAQRAVAEAAPFPKLPDGFERSSAAVEIWFQFKR